MDLLIISGFLGSGKTTILLAAARELAKSGRKIAVIENEAGKIGVDDHFLRENGLMVREIYSGCICCSLRIDLITTLLELEKNCCPDIVILEPSGVAGPKQVVQSLYGYGGEIGCKIVLSVVDAVRFMTIRDFSMPLIADGVEIADAILLNKIDQSDEARLCELERRIRELRPGAEISRVCGHSGKGLDGVIELVKSKLSTKQTVEAEMFISGNSAGETPEATVVAHGAEIAVCGLGQDKLAAHMRGLVEKIVSESRQGGCGLIGHVKAIAKGAGSYLMVSATDFDRAAEVKGAVSRNARELGLTVNAIMYGIDKNTAECIVVEAVKGFGRDISGE